MEPKFNTSFIPKKSLQADVSSSTPGKFVNRRSVTGPGYFLAVLAFLLSVIVSVGVFGYTKIIERTIVDSTTKVKAIQAALQPELISELMRIDARMKGVQRLTSGHIAVSALLDHLEAVTLNDVTYTQLTFKTEPASAVYNLTLQGETGAIPSVALQTDQFRKSEYLLSPVVTKLDRPSVEGTTKTPNARTTMFAVSMSMDPRLVSYAAALESGRYGVATAPSLSMTRDTATDATSTATTTTATGTTTPTE
jgi:hypothetical protein